MKKQTKTIIEKFASNDYPPEIQHEFHKWLVNEKHSVNKEEELYGLWLKTESKATKNIGNSYKEILSKIDKPSIKSFNLYIWQTAAAILLISTAVLSFMLINSHKHSEQSLIEEYTPVACIDSVFLPDGSLVYKNAKTTLLYPSEFTGKTRSVYLIGEATFKVKKGNQPFIVKTSDLTVTALGTEFSVEAYPDDDYISATLLSGSIAIDNLRLETQTVIKPEEQFTYYRNNHVGTVNKINTEIVTAWIDGQIIVQDKTIYEVIKTLERRFNIDFQYDRSIIEKTDRYNFKFRRNASLEEIMKVIQTVSETQFIIEKNTCTLY